MRVIKSRSSDVVHAVSWRLQTVQRGVLVVFAFCSQRFNIEADRDKTIHTEDWGDVTCGICQSSMARLKRQDPEEYEDAKKRSDMSPSRCTRHFLNWYRQNRGYVYTGKEWQHPSEKIRLWRTKKEKHTRCTKCGAFLL